MEIDKNIQSPLSVVGTSRNLSVTQETTGSFTNKLARLSTPANTLPATPATTTPNTLKDEEEKARKQAEEAAAGLVSNALILPILKQIRRSAFGENTLFSPGIGEKTFGPQFDMQLADRIAQSPRLGVKNALANRLLKRGAPASAPTQGLDVHG